MRRYSVLGIAIFCVFGIVSGYFWLHSRSVTLLSPGKGVQRTVELPYAKYTFTRLANTQPVASTIQVGDETGKGKGYTVRDFSYMVSGRRVTGQLHIPDGVGPFPTILMVRGYADVTTYTTGTGTRPAAEYYSEHGYLTIAPDMLGYGGSDPADTDPLGARLVRPVEILDLLASIPTLRLADPELVYLWGHSNGGQISLSVLEIMGGLKQNGLDGNIPKLRAAVLWAPVSKPFPYSVLVYMDEEADGGKALRKMVADFETQYNADDFSIANYWNWITTPVQVEQGTGDQLVPYWWTNDLVKALKAGGDKVSYFTYPGADHNLSTGWNTAVARDVQWFDTNGGK